LWLESSGEPFGFPFIVFRRVPGAAAGDLIEGAFRKEPATARALERALGSVHAKGRILVTSDGGRESSVPHTRELLTHYLEWWRAKKPFPSLVIESAFMWLFRKLDGGLGDATVVHADTGFHNLLLDEQQHACLLDWEFAHLGDPAEDLACCYPADLHKFGFCPKPASTVFYRTGDKAEFHHFDFAGWPNGRFTTPTIVGTRPAGGVAAAWAAFQFLGVDGTNVRGKSCDAPCDRRIAADTILSGGIFLGHVFGVFIGTRGKFEPGPHVRNHPIVARQFLR
jgi:hypothetical protein